MTKTDWVLSALREDIVSGVYKPGEKLILKTIANKYGVSEQPVREAFKTLQAERLVSSVPHIGTIVTQLDPSEIHEIFEMRSQLEIFSALRHLHDYDDEQIKLLYEQQDVMKSCLESGDFAGFSLANREFHSLLHMRSSQLLKDTLANCWRTTRSYFTEDVSRARVSYGEHEAILEAIKAKDEAEIQRTMRIHSTKMIETADRVLKHRADVKE